jgi:hypothetical protein
MPGEWTLNIRYVDEIMVLANQNFGGEYGSIKYFYVIVVMRFSAIYLTPPDTIGCGFTSFANGTGSI